MRRLYIAKTVANQENVKLFSDLVPSNLFKKKMFGASTPFNNFFFFDQYSYLK